jgi:hypothetical protein
LLAADILVFRLQSWSNDENCEAWESNSAFHYAGKKATNFWFAGTRHLIWSINRSMVLLNSWSMDLNVLGFPLFDWLSMSAVIRYSPFFAELIYSE